MKIIINTTKTLKIVDILGARHSYSRKMPWPETGVTHYHELCGLSDIGWTIKKFV